jgi:hypothetical protein
MSYDGTDVTNEMITTMMDAANRERMIDGMIFDVHYECQHRVKSGLQIRSVTHTAVVPGAGLHLSAHTSGLLNHLELCHELSFELHTFLIQLLQYVLTAPPSKEV